MGIILKTDRDGKRYRFWYGEYKIDGDRRVFNLNVPVKGTPPESLTKEGDAAFERSRTAAEKALAAFVEDARQKGRADHLTERLIESKTGRAVEYVKIADLAARWQTMGREVSPSKRYLAACNAAFNRFAAFAESITPPVSYLYAITPEQAAAYVDDLRGAFSRKTCRDHVKLLNRTFAAFLPVGAANPFAAFIGKRGNGDGAETIHRKPFTAEELHALLDTAREDDFLHPLIVTAACTGMRRGDVCRLQWQDVDLAAGMIQVKTSKTGAQVEIPIFPPLREVLDATLPGPETGKSTRQGAVRCPPARPRGATNPTRNASEYVFPTAARMIEENPDGLTWRFKKIVARAFADDSDAGANAPEPTPPAQIEADGLAAIDRLPEGPRREHLRDTFTRYMAGASVREIATATGASRGSVSGWLAAVSGMIGKPVVRAAAAGVGVKAAIAQHTRVDREHGQRAASVRDWHTLRTTWVTLALTAGVPMELVRRVTGHATVDVVLKHYFRPGREQFRAVLAGALPNVLTGGKAAKAKPADELATLAAKFAAGNATETDKARFRKLAAKV